MNEILGQGETALVGSADSSWHCHRGKKQKTAPAEELHKKIPGVIACAVSQLILVSYTSFLLLCQHKKYRQNQYVIATL